MGRRTASERKGDRKHHSQRESAVRRQDSFVSRPIPTISPKTDRLRQPALRTWNYIIPVVQIPPNFLKVESREGFQFGNLPELFPFMADRPGCPVAPAYVHLQKQLIQFQRRSRGDRILPIIPESTEFRVLPLEAIQAKLSHFFRPQQGPSINQAQTLRDKNERLVSVWQTYPGICVDHHMT